MKIRSARERIIQTLWFEVIGVLLITPLVAVALGESASNSMGLLVMLSLTAMAMAALFNTLFDWFEAKHSQRVASQRPNSLRILHALMLELFIVTATLPLLKFTLELSWLEAMAGNVALTIIYSLYAYVFHLYYDRLRPVPLDTPMNWSEDIQPQS